MIKMLRHPIEFLWNFERYIEVKEGECYFNCGCMTLLCTGDNEFASYCKMHELSISYCLGILHIKNGETYPHAWLHILHPQGDHYSDPTLQKHSVTWNNNIGNLHYELVKTMSSNDLVIWFKKNYPGREYNSYGIPSGNCQFPVINSSKVVICANTLSQ